jgi:hypothetical protein
MTKSQLKTVETNAQAYYSKKLFSKEAQNLQNPISDEMVEQLLNPNLEAFKKLFKDTKDTKDEKDNK